MILPLTIDNLEVVLTQSDSIAYEALVVELHRGSEGLNARSGHTRGVVFTLDLSSGAKLPVGVKRKQIDRRSRIWICIVCIVD